MSAILLISRAALIALLCLGASLAGAQPAQNALAVPSQPTPATTLSNPSPVPAVVAQPRPTGYFVGDLLTQRVLLQRNSQRYTPVSLPTPGRVNSWFERHRVTLETDASARRWLVIEYQLLNAPKAVTTATVPAWQLTVKSDDTTAPVTLKIPAASVNVAPLSPPGSPEQVGTRDLRPDHIPPRIATEPIRRAIAFSGGGLGVTLAAWFAWMIWRNRRADTTQPFARALRELRTLPAGEPRAWQILHRAFDHAAGRVIQSATLPVLFERAPQLIPARAQIEQFYAHSSQLFFANANPSARDVKARRASAISAPGRDEPPRTDAPIPSGRDELQRTDAPMPSGRDEPPRTDAPIPSGRDEPQRTDAPIPSGGDEPPPVVPLPLTLCLQLRRLEKHHER